MIKLIKNLLSAKQKSSSLHSEREAHAVMRSTNNKIKSKPHQETEKTQHREPQRKTVRNKPAAKKVHKPVIIEHKKKTPAKPEKLIIYPELKDETRFTDLKLHEDVLFGLQEMGFEYCTPIQAKSLPFLIDGRDTAGKAQTGTGKTANPELAGH